MSVGEDMRRKAETARARAERICSELPELREWKRPPKDAEEVLHRGFVAVGWGRWGGPSRRPLPRTPARWRRGDPFIVRNDLPPEAENPPPPLDGTGTEADWRRWCHDLVAGNVPPAELVDDFFARYDEATTLRGLCRKNPLIFLLAIVALVDYVVDDAARLLTRTVERFEQAFKLQERLHPLAPRVKVAGLTVYNGFTEADVEALEEAARRARAVVDACRAAGYEDMAVEAERRAPWPTRWRDYLPRAGPGAKIEPRRRLTYLLDYGLRHRPDLLTHNERYRLIADIVSEWTGTEETDTRIRQAVEYIRKAKVRTPPCGPLPPLYFRTLSRGVLERIGLVKPASAHELCTQRFAGASVILHYRAVGE